MHFFCLKLCCLNTNLKYSILSLMYFLEVSEPYDIPVLSWNLVCRLRKILYSLDIHNKWFTVEFLKLYLSISSAKKSSESFFDFVLSVRLLQGYFSSPESLGQFLESIATYLLMYLTIISLAWLVLKKVEFLTVKKTTPTPTPHPPPKRKTALAVRQLI